MDDTAAVPTGPTAGAGPPGCPLDAEAEEAMRTIDHTTEPRAQQTRRLFLAERAGAVPRSRDFCRRALTDWQWLPAADDEQLAAAEDVVLMVSELVTNACVHAPGGPYELRLAWDGSRLRIEVGDAGREPPRLRRPADRGAPGGHGLRVVDRLARAWGYRPERDGKTVWAEVPAPPGPRRP
ncbi:ATP-binding protein [Kitasatospora sp. NPDC086009]|uniref:ATP-binding protein n=1 Tax=unclassified Kitasatospora TaxID=2633591 RepID=UPI0037C70C98